jgi:hypothetical protein
MRIFVDNTNSRPLIPSVPNQRTRLDFFKLFSLLILKALQLKLAILFDFLDFFDFVVGAGVGAVVGGHVGKMVGTTVLQLLADLADF